MKEIEVKTIKQDFPMLKDGSLTYLDTAATSQTPEMVIEAISKYYREFRANVHRGLYPASERATQEYEDARKTVAMFLGADAGEIIFTSGATAASNMLMSMLRESIDAVSGSKIVTTALEHHAALLPIRRFASSTNREIFEIPLTDSCEIDLHVAESLIDTDTAIVSVMLASNVTGTINDVARIAQLAHEKGALVICDATAAIGHIPVDVRALDADFLYFSGHKMCGPTGIGVLYGRKELLENLEPGIVGGGMVAEVKENETLWVSGVERFEAGTPNVAGAVGLAAAIHYLNTIGLEAIHVHAQTLALELALELEKIDGVTVYAGRERNVGIVSFTVDGIHAHDIAQIAGKSNIALRAGHHCVIPFHAALNIVASTRASVYLYNTREDIDRLVAAIRAAKDTFEKS